MNISLEYIFIALIFFVAAAVASLAVIFYNKNLGQQARQLRGRLKEVKATRQASERRDGGFAPDSPLKDFYDQYLAQYVETKFIKNLIESAAAHIKPIELAGICVALGLVGMIAALFLFDATNSLSWIVSLVLPFASAVIPLVVLQRKAASRRIKFDEQFPEALGMMARTLEAGGSLTTSLGVVATELPEPSGTEFRKTADEINFGIGFNQAVANMAQRIKSQDLNFFITAITIQRETGGNLAELLYGLAKLIYERQKLARKILIISAEGRFSGNILLALPFVMAGAITALNPDYMGFFWTSEEGQHLVYVCLVMMAIGAIAIRRIVAMKT